MAKIAYIIPGYGENENSRKAYKIIASYFKEVGIRPVQVKIKWGVNKGKHVDFSAYSKQFLKKYKKNKDDQTFVLGFSFGAVIAFLTASQTKPDMTLLCSLSPYFIEDYKNLKPAWLKWWHKHSTAEISFADSYKNISTPIVLMAGSKEPPAVLFRARSARRKIKNSSFKIAKGAIHNIGNPPYLAVIKESIFELKWKS